MMRKNSAKKVSVRYAAVLLLSLFLLLIILPQDAFAASSDGNGKSNSAFTVTGKYRDGVIGETFSRTALYDDTYFSVSSTNEQRELAKLSMLASAAAYDEKDAKALLKACGFSARRVNRKIIAKDNDHVSYSIGSKKIGKKTVIAIWIKGTSGNYEWVSNFNLGTGTVHKGFSLAYEEVLKELSGYNKDLKKILKNGDKNGRYVFWITGHSRGGGVANLLAAELSSLVGPENVYAYTFASPRVSRKVVKYKNIRNYINPGDFVPEIAPAAWKYKRNGVDIVLKDSKKDAMMKSFESITGQTYAGFGTAGRKSLIKAFVKYGGKNAETYYKKRNYITFKASPADFCRKGLGCFLAGKRKKSTEYMSRIALMDSDALILIGTMGLDTNNKKIPHAHCLTGYLCWLEAMY